MIPFLFWVDDLSQNSVICCYAMNFVLKCGICIHCLQNHTVVLQKVVLLNIFAQVGIPLVWKTNGAPCFCSLKKVLKSHFTPAFKTLTENSLMEPENFCMRVVKNLNV